MPSLSDFCCIKHKNMWKCAELLGHLIPNLWKEQLITQTTTQQHNITQLPKEIEKDKINQQFFLPTNINQDYIHTNKNWRKYYKSYFIALSLYPWQQPRNNILCMIKTTILNSSGKCKKTGIRQWMINWCITPNYDNQYYHFLWR